jgi:tetratricopeptide (TPR) repeat protein
MLEELINYLVNHGEKSQAISLLNTMEKHAWRFNEYDDLAKCFFKQKNYDRAIDCSLKALITAYENEKIWVARTNLINVYNHANHPELALKYIKQAEQSMPNDIDIQLEKAYSFYLLTRKNEAEEILNNVLLTPNLTEEYITKIKFNLGTYYMYRDEFLQGLSLFLYEGKKLKYWQQETLPFTYWNGIIQPEKTIILFAEAGIGDEFINVRFIKYLTDLGMNPIWFTSRKDLANIFNRHGFKTITHKKEIPVEKDLVWTSPMTLPVLLNLNYSNLWYGPYLTSSKEFDEKFNWIKSEKIKIGIRWQGNPEYDNDLHRSVPLKDIYQAIKHIDADFYSLQRDVGLEELQDFPGLIPMHDYMTSFEDTLSIINHLDIIITTCTSIAHASAAMGKKTFIFVPISAYYTWSHSLEQSPWYGDNVTLFRQQHPRVWNEPLEKLTQLLGTI